MTESSIEHVSDTAFLIAACRALETRRPDALFRDPLAERLSGDKGTAILAGFPGKEITIWLTAVRTCIIDNYIRNEIARGVDLVINLGAGLDTRPYRLDVPADLHWVEADYPGMISYKEARLRDEVPNCSLERVAVDLADNTARRAFLDAMASRGRRILVLTEGVIPYLTNSQAGALARDLRTMSGVEGWIIDYISPMSHRFRDKRGVSQHMKQAPFQFRPDDWFGFFEVRGWKKVDIRYLAEEGKRLGRRVGLPPVTRLMITITRPFMSRQRREGFRKFAGYALMRPAPIPAATETT
jgi:methyltransferase (TIGR00027 family)